MPSSILAPMSSVEREMTPEVTIPRKKDGKWIRLLKDKTRQIPKRTTHAWLNGETERSLFDNTRRHRRKADADVELCSKSVSRVRRSGDK